MLIFMRARRAPEQLWAAAAASKQALAARLRRHNLSQVAFILMTAKDDFRACHLMACNMRDIFNAAEILADATIFSQHMKEYSIVTGTGLPPPRNSDEATCTRGGLGRVTLPRRHTLHSRYAPPRRRGLP